MGLKLEDLTLYGQFLAISTADGAAAAEVGEGVVVARGIEVVNYVQGPIIQVGQRVLFREGSQTRLVGVVETGEVEPGKVVVFVTLGNIIATIGEPPAGP